MTESGLIRSVEDDWGLSLAIDIVRKLTLLALCLNYFWERDRNGPRVSEEFNQLLHRNSSGLSEDNLHIKGVRYNNSALNLTFDFL